jgi:hypothetical protein
MDLTQAQAQLEQLGRLVLQDLWGRLDLLQIQVRQVLRALRAQRVLEERQGLVLQGLRDLLVLVAQRVLEERQGLVLQGLRDLRALVA